ncbi:MAG: hypothetical protein WDN31_16625 [Hyphomicrobium sp.]
MLREGILNSPQNCCRAGGHDPETDVIAAGAVLSAAGVEGIAACFARALGERTPPEPPRHRAAEFSRGWRQARDADRRRA